MAVGNPVSEEQARAIADNTARVWLRERNAGHLANLEALSCPSEQRRGNVKVEIDALTRGKRDSPVTVLSTGSFARLDSEWRLSTHFLNGGAIFTFKDLAGELRVCDIGPAAIP